ncbi:hypothetical protein LF887_09310 [Chryseobacterium sp. MEBOG06]|uniref:hypothetical protein n=1 Tax=Chryseobacterium sp. MEBOG06 TaxID=2879938 RepID=UPI001F2CCA80|nr:hypothetical protein [Chryseobacterium sp. MEBOG06]UKB85799.1 hypothetical protein LF887_09310 [Chryseobacterium sp. MEBOG06]
MNIKKLLQFLLLTAFLSFGNLSFAQNLYQKYFFEFWSDINENYAYLDQQQID